MIISDIPELKDKTHTLTTSKNTTVSECAKKMKDHGYGSIIIVDKKKVIGMFTERDVLDKVVALGVDPKKTKVEKVMNKKFSTAKFSDGVTSVLRRMSQGRFRHMPIVDSKGSLCGLISQGDLVAYSWSEIFHLLGDKTKSSFLTHTQVWMMILAVLVYITFVVYLIP